MNIKSEIEFFSELVMLDKSRFLALFIHELAEGARAAPASASEQPDDTQHLRFVIELQQRMGRLVFQLLSADPSRPGDDVIVRMLLSSRPDKAAEHMVHGAYRRVLQSFEHHDTNVLVKD